jgi:hypothetical protein
MTGFRKRHTKLMFFLVALGFIILWSILFLPNFIKYLNNTPNFADGFTIPVAWLIKTIGYFIAFFFIGLILTGKKHAFRFGLATLLFYIMFVIVTPPTCISINGDLLTSATNASCMSGDDAFVAWIFHFIIPFGNPLLFYFTYVGGPLISAILAILLLSKKDLWKSIKTTFSK